LAFFMSLLFLRAVCGWEPLTAEDGKKGRKGRREMRSARVQLRAPYKSLNLRLRWSYNQVGENCYDNF
jgi:hypothetical protein